MKKVIVMMGGVRLSIVLREALREALRLVSPFLFTFWGYLFLLITFINTMFAKNMQSNGTNIKRLSIVIK